METRKYFDLLRSMKVIFHGNLTDGEVAVGGRGGPKSQKFDD